MRRGRAAQPNMAAGGVLACARTGSSGLRGAISICEALCYNPHLLPTAARPTNESARVYTSAAVRRARHKQGTTGTEGSSEDTKYACTTWTIERSPPASRFRRNGGARARCARVCARSIYLRLHKHGVSVMRCSLHPSVLLAFTSLEGDNKEDLKRGWRELKKEGDKRRAPRSGVVILRPSSNLPVGFRGRREREAAARLPVVSRVFHKHALIVLFLFISSPPPHPSAM